uniref:F-actin binding domain-containing protein n=1 Tax=Anopheles christyi TaxID=43041 RepID=A0A182JPV8_9DIPT
MLWKEALLQSRPLPHVPPPGSLLPTDLLSQNQDGLENHTDSGSGSKFSTFGNKQPSTAGVQMRRTTNKRGKTAPAPPKRTSLLSSSRDSTYRDDDNCKLGEGEQSANGTAIPITKSSSCSSFLIDKLFRGFSRDMANLMNRATDSENEQTEVTPDTDTDNPEPVGFQKTPQQSSFKRAPIMGNRGLETRGSKRLPQQARRDQLPPGPVGQPCTPVLGPGQPPIVGALEVQNVKKAINRYGTLPKDARIGAYLESLRQSDGSVIQQGQPPVQQQLPQHQQPQQQHAPGPLPAAAQMQMGMNPNMALISEPPPPPMAAANAISNSILAQRNAAAIKAQPQMIRSNSSSGVTMSNSATASLSKLQRHRTTTDGSMMTFSSFRGSVGNNSPKRAGQPTLADLEFPPPPVDLPPPPEEFDMPLDQRGGGGASMLEKSIAPSNDVRNTEPSVEEASSRFGVSLRKREPSTDSCSSLGSPADAMINTMGDPSSLPIPPPPPAKDLKADMKRITNVPKCLQGDAAGGKKSVGPLHGTSDPASQLVSELAESMHLPKAPSPLTTAQEPQHQQQSQQISHYKSSDVSSLRKPVSMSKSTILPSTNTSASDNYSAATNVGPGVPQPSFKAQLKKVDAAKRTPSQPAKKEESMGGIIDFKSRLRKVDQNNAEVSSNGGGDTVEPVSNVDNNNKHQSGNSLQSIHNNNNINSTVSSNSNGNILNNNDNSASSSSSENENHRSAKKSETGTPLVVRNGTAISSKNSMDSSNKLLLENNELNSLKLKKTNVASTIVTGTAPIDSNKVIELKKTEIKIELSDDRKRESLEGNSLKVDSGGGSGDNLSTGSSGAGGEEGDGKRKSTGSISSLKKLWEAKESPGGDPLSAQLSPKLGTKSVANMVPKMNNNMEAEEGSVGGGHDSTQQQDQLQQPNAAPAAGCVSSGTLGSNKKPAVPMKPSKFSSIYATPVQNIMQTTTSTMVSLGSSGGGTSNTSNIYAKSNDSSSSSIQQSDKSSSTLPTSTTGSATPSAGGRENILDLVQLLQTSMKQPVSNISASQWLALSDRLNSLQSCCVTFADNESLPPHAKFHFRELVTRVENQARSLRSASNKNVQDNEKLVQEVGQSLKQISNALHR